MADDPIREGSDAFTEASLYGTKQSLISNLGIRKLPIITTDNALSVFKEEFDAKGSENFPYAYLKMTEFVLDKERLNNKTVARRGTSVVSLDTNSLVTKNYQFSSKISLTLHYMDTDFRRLLIFVERFSIINAIQGFNFRITLPKVTPWIAELYSESDSVSIPSSTSEDDQLPAVYPLEIPLVLKTKCGLTKDVPLSKGTVVSSMAIGAEQTKENL